MGISLGLVGLGSFGSGFADMFMSHPLVDRIGLCDREPERIEKFSKKESWKAKLNDKDIYHSLDDICESDLDALVIITQHWLHAPQCLQAMESGKHVYSAVPIISIPDDDEILDLCDKLVETSRRTGMQYMLGETTYYRPQAMYCRRRAAEGAFGDFVYTEGEYFHDVDNPGCNLRDVWKHRANSAAGQEGKAIREKYIARGCKGGPMHYPTHSTSGPICVMGAHALKVSGMGYVNRDGDDFFVKDAFSNEIGLYQMSNGSVMRICEMREFAHAGREIFRIGGNKAAFDNDEWQERDGTITKLSVDDMRDPLPDAVVEAFKKCSDKSDFYGGHGGSHAYLVNEFVDAVANERMNVINIWEAARYMAAGVMAHKSALQGGVLLDVPDWGDAPG